MALGLEENHEIEYMSASEQKHVTSTKKPLGLLFSLLMFAISTIQAGSAAFSIAGISKLHLMPSGWIHLVFYTVFYPLVLLAGILPEYKKAPTNSVRTGYIVLFVAIAGQIPYELLKSDLNVLVVFIFKATSAILFAFSTYALLTGIKHSRQE